MTERALTLKDPEPRDVDIWERTESTSVINRVPPHVAAAFHGTYQEKPELFGLDERDLFKKLRNDNKQPSATDNRLRMQFWLEYDRSITDGKPMTMANVYAGICSRQYFHAAILSRAEKIAWMLTPPVSYVMKMEEALDYGVDRLRDILEIDPNTYAPALRLKFMELQTKIVVMLDQRVKGGIIQRVEQKNMNLHVSTTDKQVAKVLTQSSMEDLNKRIKELERRERKALNLPEGPGGDEEAQVVEVEVGATTVRPKG